MMLCTSEHAELKLCFLRTRNHCCIQLYTVVNPCDLETGADGVGKLLLRLCVGAGNVNPGHGRGRAWDDSLSSSSSFSVNQQPQFDCCLYVYQLRMKTNTSNSNLRTTSNPYSRPQKRSLSDLHSVLLAGRYPVVDRDCASRPPSYLSFHQLSRNIRDSYMCPPLLHRCSS